MLDTRQHDPNKIQDGWWKNDPSIHRSGFGFILHQDDDGWRVSRTLIGSPADKAGISSGCVVKAIDDFEIGTTIGEFHELGFLLNESNDKNHIIKIYMNSEIKHIIIEKKQLAEMIEHDFNNGGNLLGYCVGCRTCRSVTTGATNCYSGCPGTYCTVS